MSCDSVHYTNTASRQSWGDLCNIVESNPVRASVTLSVPLSTKIVADEWVYERALINFIPVTDNLRKVHSIPNHSQPPSMLFIKFPTMENIKPLKAFTYRGLRWSVLSVIFNELCFGNFYNYYRVIMLRLLNTPKKPTKLSIKELENFASFRTSRQLFNIHRFVWVVYTANYFQRMVNAFGIQIPPFLLSIISFVVKNLIVKFQRHNVIFNNGNRYLFVLKCLHRSRFAP